MIKPDNHSERTQSIINTRYTPDGAELKAYIPPVLTILESTPIQGAGSNLIESELGIAHAS